MRSFRSKAVAASFAFGPFTAFPTYNPSESTSSEVMGLAGHPFGYDANGFPDDQRPSSTERLAIVASRPAACAVYFSACMTAVQRVAYGWDSGAHTQSRPDCLFGQV